MVAPEALVSVEPAPAVANAVVPVVPPRLRVDSLCALVSAPLLVEVAWFWLVSVGPAPVLSKVPVELLVSVEPAPVLVTVDPPLLVKGPLLVQLEGSLMTWAPLVLLKAP